jgi:hypothetical protein
VASGGNLQFKTRSGETAFEMVRNTASSMITKYVADRRDIEISFAQIAGTNVLAPFRLMVPTLIGTKAVQATSFETS